MASNDFRQRVVFELVDKSSKKAKTIATSFEKIKTAVAGLAVFAVVTRAIQGFVRVLNKASDAAAVQEKAVKKLNIALSRTGAVEQYSGALQAQAAELQKLGLAGDEAIIATQALLIEMGVAPARMKEATEATLNLSAAFGLSLENAARNIGRTIGGLAGELGELIPELKAMQAEGRLAGEGIEFLNKRFAGAAAGQMKLYANVVERLSSTIGDLSEALGKGQNDQAVADQLSALTTSIRLAGAAVEGSNLSDGLGLMKEGIIALGRAFFQTGIQMAQHTGLLKSNLEIAKEQGDELIRLNAISRAAAIETKKLADGEAALQKVWKASLVALKARLEALKETTDAEASFLESVRDLGVVLEQDVNEAMEANVRLLEEADGWLRKGLIGRREYEDITRAVAQAERDFTVELKGTGQALEVLDQTFGQAKGSIDAYTLATEAATGATERFTVAATNAATPIGGGTSLGNGISGLDRRKTILGGTREQVRGGGSRLERA